MATHEKEGDQEKLSKFLQDMEWLDDPADEMYKTQLNHIRNKIKKNPLVPIGCIATAAVLGLGFRNFLKSGQQKKSQAFMRWRVGLQGATIAVMICGILYEQYLHPKKMDI